MKSVGGAYSQHRWQQVNKLLSTPTYHQVSTWLRTPYPASVTPRGSQFVKGVRAMSSQLAAASYIYVHYALKKKRKERRWWQRQLYTSREVYSGSSLLADLNFQSVSGLYKNFTRMSPSEFEFLINLIGKKNLEKGNSVQEIHFCSRKVGTDATLLGKWRFVS